MGYSADVNECVSPDNNDCEQTCVNTNGSYSCDCVIGYVLNADGHACDGRFILKTICIHLACRKSTVTLAKHGRLQSTICSHRRVGSIYPLCKFQRNRLTKLAVCLVSKVHF